MLKHQKQYVQKIFDITTNKVRLKDCMEATSLVNCVKGNIMYTLE